MSKTHTYTIGGSQLAAILGFDPNKRPLDLFASKRGLSRPKPMGAPARSGLYFEAGVLDWYADDTGREVFGLYDEDNELELLPRKRGGGWTRADRIRWRDDFLEDCTPWRSPRGIWLLRSKRWPWLVANPDGLVWDDERGLGVLDAKNLDRDKRGTWDKHAPVQYLLQLDVYLAVLGPAVRWGALAAVFGGQELGHLDHDRTDERLEYVVEVARRFVVEHLEPGNPPRFEPDPRDLEALAAVYPKPPEPTLVRCPEHVQLDGHRLTAAMFDAEAVEAWAQRPSWKRRADEVKAVILDLMGDADLLELPDGTVYSRASNNAITRRPPRRRGARR